MQDIQIDDDETVPADGGPFVAQFDAPAFAAEEDLDTLFGEDEEPEHLDHGFPDDDRVARLEGAVKALAGDRVEREGRRVRRKVTAAGGGAGVVGVVPVVLQLAGALDLSPELASALATVAAALGALAIGYLTPERKAPISPAELLAAD